MYQQEDLHDRRSATPTEQRRPATVALPWEAWAMLGLTCVLWGFLSHHTLLRGDEHFDIFTDQVTSLRELLRLQRTSPIVLDPFAYHAMESVLFAKFGDSPFVFRLPALVGFLLMQASLFLFVRGVASKRAALFAMGFPALTNALDFSLNGRPYAMLMGLTGVTILSWQIAVRRMSQRTLPLAVLAVGIALIINTHYFGVLILAPFVAVECFRAARLRRFDLPVYLALGVGAASVVFTLPFTKAATQFRNHYYFGLESLNSAALAKAYLWTLSQHPFKRLPAGDLNHGFVLFNEALLGIVIVLLVAAVAAGLSAWKPRTSAWVDSYVLLIAVAALPFFGFVVARFTSHILEPRYVFGLLVGVSGLTALGLSPLLNLPKTGRAVLAGMFAAIVCIGAVRDHYARLQTELILSQLQIQPSVRSWLLADPARRLYYQEWEAYAEAMYYEPDPAVRSRFTFVYSIDEEYRWNHATQISVGAINLRNFNGYSVAPFESVVAQPGPHLFVDCKGYDNWTEKAFAEAHAMEQTIGNGPGCDTAAGETHLVKLPK